MCEQGSMAVARSSAVGGAAGLLHGGAAHAAGERRRAAAAAAAAAALPPPRCEIRCVQLVLRGVPAKTVPATLALTLELDGGEGSDGDGSQAVLKDGRGSISVDGRALRPGEAATTVLRRQWDDAVTFLASSQVIFEGARVRFVVTAGSGALVLKGTAGPEGLQLMHDDGDAASSPEDSPPDSPKAGAAADTAASTAAGGGTRTRQCAEFSLLGSFGDGREVAALVSRAPVAPAAFRQRRLSFSPLDVIREDTSVSGASTGNGGRESGGGGDGRDAVHADDSREWCVRPSTYCVPSAAHERQPHAPFRDDAVASGSSHRGALAPGDGEGLGGLLSHVTPARWGGKLEEDVAWLTSGVTQLGAATAFGAALGVAMSATVLVRGASLFAENRRLLPRVAWRGLGKQRSLSPVPSLSALTADVDGVARNGERDAEVDSSPVCSALRAPLPPKPASADAAATVGSAPWALAIAHQRLVSLSNMGTQDAKDAAVRYMYHTAGLVTLAARKSKAAVGLGDLYNATSIAKN